MGGLRQKVCYRQVNCSVLRRGRQKVASMSSVAEGGARMRIFGDRFRLAFSQVEHFSSIIIQDKHELGHDLDVS